MPLQLATSVTNLDGLPPVLIGKDQDGIESAQLFFLVIFHRNTL